MKNAVLSYLSPAVLSVLIFISNFLNPNIFTFNDNNYAVWFILSLFCFSCGWLIDKSLGWQFGGKVLFSITIAASIISISFIAFFSEYFSAENLSSENLILYSLRNVTLGCMGFFGMAVAEVFILQKNLNECEIRREMDTENKANIKKEAELIIKEADITAKGIIATAETEARNIILKKERIELELKEFIQIEKELLKKYESEETD